jgi:molybdopterin converting factor small subunit
MTITVNLWGQLKQNAGVGGLSLELQDEACSGENALRELARLHKDALGKLLLTPDGAVRRSTLLFRGDQQLSSLTEALKDGDTITVMSPISGG